jgi:hypothetical protein
MDDFRFYLGLGWEHILSWNALDHLLFITALSAIYLWKDWKQVLILVTAFTIGHSLTLALTVLDLIRFPSNWVEFLIPCTIVVTAISNLFIQTFTNRAMKINYLLALLFGLVHGMGFANTIRMMLAKDQQIAWPLVGFNVGLELGQILVVSFILFLGAVVVQVFKLNRRDWVIFVSAGVFSLAIKMALERVSSL